MVLCKQRTNARRAIITTLKPTTEMRNSSPPPPSLLPLLLLQSGARSLMYVNSLFITIISVVNNGRQKARDFPGTLKDRSWRASVSGVVVVPQTPAPGCPRNHCPSLFFPPCSTETSHPPSRLRVQAPDPRGRACDEGRTPNLPHPQRTSKAKRLGAVRI